MSAKPETEWDIKEDNKVCAQHKVTGHRVNKIGEQYEVWYKVGTKYIHGGMSDKATAMRKARQIQPEEIA